MSKDSAEPSYGRLTPLMMMQLAAPHTWSAAVMPVLLGVSYAAATGHAVSVHVAIIMLLIAILTQSAVNTLNDYIDYLKGTDTKENQLDPTDAVLVYNNVNPKSAFAYFIVLIVLAFALGVYIVIRTSWISLAIGVFAALIIVLYSAGKTPLSHLPLGEFVSGFTMGGLIGLATCYVLIGEIDWLQLVVTIPLILSIGLINMTNNTCDIDKDIPAHRRTLPVLLGREKSLAVYHAFMYLIVASIVVLIAVLFPKGLLICVCMLVAMYPGFKALKSNPLVMQTRGPAMGQVVNLNIMLGTFYCAAMLFGGSATLLV